MLVLGSTCFNVSERDATGVLGQWQLSMDHSSCTLLKKKRKGNDFKKIESVNWGAGVNIALNPLDDKTFTVQYYNKGHTLEVVNDSRDVVVLAFRLFNALGTDDICEEVCGPELSQRWKKGKMKKGGREVLDTALKEGLTEFPSKSLSVGYDNARNTLIGFKFAAVANK